ncbi:MAG: pyridoxal phosphate-dependent aminotransferase [Bacteroidia bacterium]|nr:pyridoxal phosphate-dependent aminotransferase [Bacteroidia bacterium]
MFSGRIPWSLTENPLTAELARKRSEGGEILDLTLANPTEAGFTFDPHLPEAFARPEVLRYSPHPKGLAAAREAISRYYADAGCTVSADAIHCTAGTSEAYSFLFKLLCDPENSVLIPHPAYPLFEYLAALDSVRLRPYKLRRSAQGLWRIDFGSLDDACSDRPRAVVVVNPSNPVGAYLDPDDLAHLRVFCERRNIALIVDEVFWDFPLARNVLRSRTVEENSILTFTLNGLSKLAGLPQLKLGWIVSSGPERLVAQARSRLDLIADAFLSVGTPVMLAADTLLTSRVSVQEEIRTRCITNYAVLKELLSCFSSLHVPEVQGGWTAVINLPKDTDEEHFAMNLLRKQSVYVHPGYFFDFPRGVHAVVSLLTPPAMFAEGVKRIAVEVGE